MAIKTTKVLKTQFTCENGEEMSVNLDSYKEDITDSEIQSSVEAMLASGALASIGAQKIETTSTDVVFI